MTFVCAGPHAGFYRLAINLAPPHAGFYRLAINLNHSRDCWSLTAVTEDAR